MTAFLFLHIAGGSLAVVAGYSALFASKGGRLHGRTQTPARMRDTALMVFGLVLGLVLSLAESWA